MYALELAAIGSGITFLCTAIGATLVYLVGNSRNHLFTQLSLGFSAGIMISASVFGLLLPAMKYADETATTPVSVFGGFVMGVVFLILLDRSLPHLHTLARKPEGPHTSLSRHTLLFLAITIHNVPEGMALGVCAAAAAESAQPVGALIALTLGIGLQNIPEGTAVSVPYFAHGMTRLKAGALGALSGIVEPLGAMAVVLFAHEVVTLLPWFLSFAAGAMLYVVIEELIPESHRLGNKENDLATISVLSGFLLMMALDTLLD